MLQNHLSLRFRGKTYYVEDTFIRVLAQIVNFLESVNKSLQRIVYLFKKCRGKNMEPSDLEGVDLKKQILYASYKNKKGEWALLPMIGSY